MGLEQWHRKGDGRGDHRGRIEAGSSDRTDQSTRHLIVDTVPNYVRDSSLHSCRPIAYESPFEARAGGPAYAPIETPTGIAPALNELLFSPTGAAGIAIAKQAVPGKSGPCPSPWPSRVEAILIGHPCGTVEETMARSFIGQRVAESVDSSTRLRPDALAR
jgi:hypothetical protein